MLPLHAIFCSLLECVLKREWDKTLKKLIGWVPSPHPLMGGSTFYQKLNSSKLVYLCNYRFWTSFRSFSASHFLTLSSVQFAIAFELVLFVEFIGGRTVTCGMFATGTICSFCISKKQKDIRFRRFEMKDCSASLGYVLPCHGPR